ncbi:hypothetical protein COW57_00170 [Candidatus Roizmanbacteria bacterium CG17_big_fil_post_rev_8_21_14_2_50_39_7]|uniref:Polymerase nucleotidyl transferase domain-containing protein n=2 Tax=Candidatus Roizmaniibacteriota TaxID=1752723 RepID=A0A2M7EL70_9BACT|nr:MAG: hypothetical protein COS52_02395 [Candidatus Roizmanbacteria bacterium CG03_land_8_20_14_0_80_39_12]PIV71321.1 MAG: hypothetical protein COW57_00170 [Candidatus Roizmanbacteria bacterium CG17_big_fil_post_rev_8_21_14_2_50_39_7]
MRKHLSLVLEYFAFFSYVPSFSEIYTFFPKKITKKDLKELLIREIKGKTIVKSQRLQDYKLFSLFHCSTNHYSPSTPLRASISSNPSRYTLPQYSITALSRHSRVVQRAIDLWSKGGNPRRLDPCLRRDDNTKRIQIYMNSLRLFPFIRFVGITGATAMNGYSPFDDIDLFIITRKSALWTARFFVVVLAKLLGIYGGVGVCLNLFFDEGNMTIPLVKQNSYIAHELLQMKPIVDKENMYSALLEANAWIFTIFPNIRSVIPASSKGRLTFGQKAGIQDDWIPASAGMTQKIDLFFKSLQLPIIKKNKTGFRITNHQLWLFRHDFEEKLKRKDLGR